MDEGEEAEGGMGYRYFGAAKNLPGVKELLKPPGNIYCLKKGK